MWKKLINFIIVYMLLTVVFTTVQINVKANSLPVADAGNDYKGYEGVLVEFNGSGSYDPDFGDVLEYRWKINGSWTEWSLDPTTHHIWYDEVTITLLITLEVRDNNFGVNNDTMNVTILNSPPSVEAGDDKTALEGDLVYFNGSFTDLGIYDIHTSDWDLDYDSMGFDSDVFRLNVTNIWYDDFEGMVLLRVDDGDDDGRENCGIGYDFVERFHIEAEIGYQFGNTDIKDYTKDRIGVDAAFVRIGAGIKL